MAACATQKPLRAEPTTELSDLRAEIRALQSDNLRLTQRLERLEMSLAVSRGSPGAVATKSSSSASPASASSGVPGKPRAEASLPALTVVKLKPKAEAAPSLDTRVEIVEPDPEVVIEQLKAADRGPKDELDGPTGDAVFGSALDALKSGNLEGGVARLRDFAAQNPHHPKADNAIYFAGVGLMGSGENAEAMGEFERLLRDYPASDAVTEAMLKLGECRTRLNRVADAKAIYQRLVDSYPGTAAATQAQARLTSLDHR